MLFFWCNVLSEHRERQETFARMQRKQRQHQEIQYDNMAQQLERLIVEQGHSWELQQSL